MIERKRMIHYFLLFTFVCKTKRFATANILYFFFFSIANSNGVAKALHVFFSVDAINECNQY